MAVPASGMWDRASLQNRKEVASGKWGEVPGEGGCYRRAGAKEAEAREGLTLDL